MSNRLKSAREERGWSQSQLIGEMERVAKRRGLTLPGRETLKARVSRWENNHARPDDFYRQILREALGLDDRELGFATELDDAAPTAAEELDVKLNLCDSAEAPLLESLQSQTDAIRQQNRQYGAGALLEQMRGHVANIEQHLEHSVFDAARRPLAWLLADASALAGWQALDLRAVDQAWRYFEIANRAAEQASDTALRAFARVEQAHVLADLGQSEAAAQLTEMVWEEAHAAVAPGVRCWLAAAAAEMHADARHDRAAQRMLTQAETAAGQLDGDLPPYLVFNAAHLQRWIGHSLALMEDAAAEEPLNRAAAEMCSTFTRATAALRTDLAACLRMRGEPAEAEEQLRRAELLAWQVGSRRQLWRIRRLRGAS